MIRSADARHPRRALRQKCGVVVTLLSSFASLATSGTEIPYASHAATDDQELVLERASPEQRFRYRVGSVDGQFTLRVTARMRDEVTPNVALEAIHDSVQRIESWETRRWSQETYGMQLDTSIQVGCDGAVPCFAELEVTVSTNASNDSAEPFVGWLTVSMEDDRYGYDEEAYLSIEQLP